MEIIPTTLDSYSAQLESDDVFIGQLIPLRHRPKPEYIEVFSVLPSY